MISPSLRAGWLSPPELHGLEGEECRVHPDVGRLRGDLQLVIYQFKTRLRCSFFYNNEIFCEESAKGMAQTMVSVLRLGVANPQAPVVLGLDSSEKTRIAQFSIGPERLQYFKAPLVQEAFAAVALQHPDRRCLCYEGEWLSYGEVAERVQAAASGLAVLGVGPGTVVGVMLDRSFELIVSILAVLSAGGCYLPCDPSYPDDRLAVYLEDGNAPIVLVQARHDERATSMVGSNVRVVDVAGLAGDGSTALKNPGPEDPAYIIFTSGSTGRPKGVVIPHRGLRDLLPWLVDRHRIG